MPNIWVGFGIVILVLTGLLGIQTYRLDTSQKEFAAYKTEVKVIGKQAQLAADKQKASDIKKQEKVNVQNKILRAANTALSRELRDSRASSNYVPTAPASSTSPNIASFSRAELERAIRRLDAGVQELIDKGDFARIDLDSARTWAKEINP